MKGRFCSPVALLVLVMDGGTSTVMSVETSTPSNVAFTVTVPPEPPARKVEVAWPLPPGTKAAGCVVVMLPPLPLLKVTGKSSNTARWPLSAAVEPELS